MKHVCNLRWRSIISKLEKKSQLYTHIYIIGFAFYSLNSYFLSFVWSNVLSNLFYLQMLVCTITCINIYEIIWELPLTYIGYTWNTNMKACQHRLYGIWVSSIPTKTLASQTISCTMYIRSLIYTSMYVVNLTSTELNWIELNIPYAHYHKLLSLTYVEGFSF